MTEADGELRRKGRYVLLGGGDIADEPGANPGVRVITLVPVDAKN